MTFLSKLGSFLAKAIAIATGIGPIIAPFIGSKGQAVETKAVNDLTAIGQVIVQAESLLQAQGGAAKLDAATPLVMSILQTSELVSGHKLADKVTTKDDAGNVVQMTGEELFARGSKRIASGTADILNAIHPDAVKEA